ncbi:MAG: molybdopterin-dependent oxidoreductase [Candidatus Heimdallarchaeota archaeon]|nr:molybdopterin-dependent oxidoreductase [Candidatus Heimdallarchaeota archaeon]
MDKKTLALILIVNIVLLSTVVTLYFTIWKPNRTGVEGYLTISGDINSNIILNITQLEAMPKISQEYFIQGNPNILANYTGVSVYYLITEIANYTNPNSSFKVKAIDNYQYVLTMNQINSTRDIIIAYMKDGEYLKSGSEGGTGPLRLIIPQSVEEYNGQYCVKYVVLIEIIQGD